MKRAFDLIVSASALLLLSPFLVAVAVAVWLNDFHSPFYISLRAARGGRTFKMVKFRSMTVGADRAGVDSTAATDTRITPAGKFIRAYKLDELMQLWNVFTGDMSLVGPRPQVVREVLLYTDAERKLLTVKPGITDMASIVFADEGDILRGFPDPDLAYHQLIRPWKSRLGLLYVQHSSLWLDTQLVVLTAVALASRARALAGVRRVLERLGADELTRRVAARDAPLTPHPPPGSAAVVTGR
jgi:lipopolysaccharide/colanic/teichoic acid biosynthesis glycosyltransferase